MTEKNDPAEKRDVRGNLIRPALVEPEQPIEDEYIEGDAGNLQEPVFPGLNDDFSHEDRIVSFTSGTIEFPIGICVLDGYQIEHEDGNITMNEVRFYRDGQLQFTDDVTLDTGEQSTFTIDLDEMVYCDEVRIDAEANSGGVAFDIKLTANIAFGLFPHLHG